LSFLATALASSANSTSTISEVEPGAICFLIVAALGIALYFLMKSMGKQFKKLGPPPEEKGADVSMRAATAENAENAEAKQPEGATKSK